jgi:magnesium-protoporphyrin O-methyltransferase
MGTANYEQRRAQIEQYFDRTAADTWAKLTSDVPVSGIRRTVRAGRDAMRATLLDWLPEDLSGRRVLDAGCGTGALAVEVARRGADVVAIDLSATLVQLAQERIGNDTGAGSIEFQVGDMRNMQLGDFDHIVAMDSLIHYSPKDGIQTLAAMAQSVSTSILFTFAPKTPLLALMHSAGKLFPRGDRSPAIEPISVNYLRRSLQGASQFDDWVIGRDERINSGFYISHGLEIVRK